MDPRSELDQIRQRAEDATDGPWFGSMGESVVFGRIPGDEVAQCARRADARFVQASRTDVPRLVAALTAALDMVDRIDAIEDEIAHRPTIVRHLRAAITDHLRSDR